MTRTPLRLALAAAVFCSCIMPVNVEAVCNVTTTQNWDTGTLIVRSKVVPTAVGVPGACTKMSANASYCGDVQFNSSKAYFPAVATSNAVDPYCEWNCTGCGIVRIDKNDGLPVELIHFGID